MGTVDCDSETDHFPILNLEFNKKITIGDMMESNPLKDVIVNDDASFKYPETVEINNDLQKKTSEKSLSEIQYKDSVEKESDVKLKGEGSGLDKFVNDLIEELSKTNLNPMAKEFVPQMSLQQRSGQTNPTNDFGLSNGTARRWKRRNPNSYKKRRPKSRTSLAQREERIKRTVYVCDIDQQITEDFLALLFSRCGQIVDCRLCIDPNSIRRTAFIEFTEEVGAATALISMSGSHVGFYPIKVLPSRTAIEPVNPTYLPRSDSEREICNRTIYCKNIDKKVTESYLKNFFQQVCGKVSQLKLLGNDNKSTCNAFVEFVLAESAITALSHSSLIMDSSHIRISPSKTPIRSLAPRQVRH